MGQAIKIFHGPIDYHFRIESPSKNVQILIGKYSAEIRQEIREKDGQRWCFLDVSSFLLAWLLKQDQVMQSIWNEEMKDKCWSVDNCGKNEVLLPEVYQKMVQKCNERSQCPNLTVVKSAFKDHNAFGFQKPGVFYNLNLTDPLDTKQCQQVPAQYLLLELKQTYRISVVRQDKAELVFQSPFNEKLVLRTIQKTLARQDPSRANLVFSKIIDEIFEKGNYEKVDLLGQDIFGGSQNCALSMVPPKINASAMAKFASQSEPTSTIYDQLQSLLVHFAINIGKLAHQTAQRTQIKTAIFVTNEISHRRFLHFMTTSFSIVGQLWFVIGKESCRKGDVQASL